MRPVRALRVIVSLALLAWVVYAMRTHRGADQLVLQLAHVRMPWLVLACVLPCVAVLFGVFRWSLLLREEGVVLPLSWLVRHTLIGRFVGAFTPSTTGLDGYRTLAVARKTGETAAASRALVLEKVVGLTGLAAVTALCAALGVSGVSKSAAWLGIAVCLGCSIAGYVVVRRPSRIAMLLPARFVLVSRLRKLLLQLSGSTAKRSALALAIGLGLLSHAATAAVFVASAWSVGVQLDASVLFGVGNALVVVTLLPVSVGGVGVREGVAVVLLGALGVATGHAVLVAVVGYLGGQVPAIFGGLLAALERGESHARSEAQAQR